MLERVIWESRVWVNGQFMGARNSLATPHRYEIGAALKPGRNEIVIRVDNRRQLAIGSPHAYTGESQTIWNGIIGRIALVAQDKVRVSRLELRPDLARQGVKVTVRTHNGSGSEVEANLVLQAAPDNFRGKPLPPLESLIRLAPGGSERTIFYPMGTNFQQWSEFNPKLYRIAASLEGRAVLLPAQRAHQRDHGVGSADAGSPGARPTFGMCEFKAAGRHFTINGHPTFLRGTVNCCEFPKTGYPGLAEIPKYNGVLRNLAFEAIRADLKRKGLPVEAPDYTRDSGKLAALLYKEEIERALRTTNQAGFELLELNDFPGQGTSTVGMLDAFWDSKGLITPKEFREFCGPVVPLLLMPKRVYQSDEEFDAGIEVANFGAAPIKDANIVWNILDGGKEIGTGSFEKPVIPQGGDAEIGQIRQSLSGVGKPAKLMVTVSVRQASGLSPSSCSVRDRRDACPADTNHWAIWVYPAREAVSKTNDIAIFRTLDGPFYQALREGKRVLLLPSRADVKSPLAAQFVPVFWNPVMFPNQPGTMGAMIDVRSPVFAEFPTDPWTNWQWWGLLHRSFAINLENVSPKVAMPFRFVDKFNRNALPAAIFEARVGPGRLLVCTLDIMHHLDRRLAARQLRRSILEYMAGREFQPLGALSPSELERLFR